MEPIFNTQTITCRGVIIHTVNYKPAPCEMTVGFTSEPNLETLSISARETTYSVPFAEVEKLIARPRAAAHSYTVQFQNKGGE